MQPVVDKLTALFSCRKPVKMIGLSQSTERNIQSENKMNGEKEDMILADKIIAERKKNGWSQEELAEKIGVTRQAVSKWEGAQTTPDLQKLLQMSKVFGVSADYLLKDEMDAPDYVAVPEEEAVEALRKVSMEEANHFLQVKKETASQIAFAVLLCILSPVCLFLLGAAAEFGMIPMSEDMAGGLGMMILLVIIAIACAIFIFCGSKTKAYEFLEKELIETEYGVTGMVKERKSAYEATYTRYNILGTVTCILGAVPLFTISMRAEEDYFAVVMLALLFVLEAIGVRFFVIAGINQASFDKLLQEGDYSIAAKKKSPLVSAVSTIYWLVTTAIFLYMGFSENDWRQPGLIWPIAGVLFPAVLALVKCFDKNK